MDLGDGDLPDSGACTDRATDGEQVQALFIRHTDLIRGFIRALLPDRVRADDVMQETFLTVVRKAADFDPASSFPKWACAIARYKVMEELRRMGKATGTLRPQVLEALAVNDAATRSDPRAERLETCLRRLPENLRRLVQLRYEEDHPPGEVAQRIGWTANSVYVGLSRARALLRECLESGERRRA